MSTQTRSQSIDWYRSPVEPEQLKKLYARSDALGWAQSMGYLGLLLTTGTTAFYSWYHWHWWVTALIIYVHGTCCAFCANAVHEIGHDTVFKTKALNQAFVHIFAFIGMVNHRMFETSHVRHHRSTLHPPDDLEVVVPIKITLKDFLLFGFINYRAVEWIPKFHARVARGVFVGEWELKLFPESNPERRKWVANWAKTLIIGHCLILVAAVCLRLWPVIVLVTLAPTYGGWLQFLCNWTQHVGLKDNVDDYRLNTRTYLLNPVVSFLYWHMNYHIEHHMYPGVPCYNLAKLHRLIENDLPPSPKGLLQVWLEINKILVKQAADPEYQHNALPTINAS